MQRIQLNIPTFFTIARLVLSPILLPALLVFLLPYNAAWLNSFLALFFVLLALTDFFDGYLARRWQQETVIGKVLDPIADKFLISSTLIALLAANKLSFVWVLILISRELFVIGIRHVALSSGFSIPVSFFGKAKTVLQVICLTIIIANPYQNLGWEGAAGWHMLEIILLFLTVSLSLYSAWHYYQKFIDKWSSHVCKHDSENLIQDSLSESEDINT